MASCNCQAICTQRGQLLVSDKGASQRLGKPVVSVSKIKYIAEFEVQRSVCSFCQGVPNLIFFGQRFAGSYQQKTIPKTEFSALRMVDLKNYKENLNLDFILLINNLLGFHRDCFLRNRL